MSGQARNDLQKRSVEIDREKLLNTLNENKKKHIKEYEEAMEGYKDSLLEKIEAGFNKAKQDLDKKFEQAKTRVSEMEDSDIEKQRDYFTLVDAITVEMRVPKCYADEYDAAIDIALWDVRETLELTYAEFNCFVRDEWDWRSDFDTVTKMYGVTK